jgi:hypothetical protein
MFRFVFLFLSFALSANAVAGDGNRLVKTFPDGGRLYSKHDLVGRCKLEMGAALPCASSSVNEHFSVKYAGYWFPQEQQAYFDKADRGEVSHFTEDKIGTCTGTLRYQNGQLSITSPPEGICLAAISTRNPAMANAPSSFM